MRLREKEQLTPYTTMWQYDTNQGLRTMIEMETKEVVQKGNLLKAKLSISNYNTPFGTKTSPEYLINGAAQFQLRLTAVQVVSANTYVYNNLLFVRFCKRRPDDNLTYMIYFKSEELNIANKTFTSDDGTWHLIHEARSQQFTFNVTVEMHVMPSANSFASLHGDTELTDFELRGEDGAVRVHRAVLAAASPVLRRMLTGAWREAREGHVDVPGTSAATLEHLKDYLYLQTLPESGLEQLLLLSAYYIMPEMEQRCIDKLLQGATTAESLWNLIEFSIKNNAKNLSITILEYIQYGIYNITEMRDQLNKDIPTTDDDESKKRMNVRLSWKLNKETEEKQISKT